MTERARRRNSKWDLKEDSQHFSAGIRENNAWIGRSGESFQDEGSKSERHLLKAKENVKSDYNDISPPMKTWDADESYNVSMSPGLEGWRERNHSRSPRSGSSRLLRSRSRSPLHGFRREFEGQNDRSRSGSGASTPSCKDFAAGRCRRGGHCRFLHNDNRNYEERRYSANARGENWRSRNEKGESFGHANSEEQARYSQDKVSGLHEDHREGNWEKDEGIRNISAERCNNFLKGRCFRGSSCKYVHDADIADDHGARERTHYKRDRNASFGNDYRREPDRMNSIPCKYFAAGNCHHGVSCRFSHESSERRPSPDERWSQKMDDEKRLWHGPKGTDNVAADSIHGDVERRSGDDILGHGVGKQDSLWRGRKWGDEIVVSDANSPQQRNGSNGGKLSDNADRRLWEGSKWIDEIPSSDIMKPSNWRSDSDDERVGNKAGNTSWVGRKWSQEAAESELRKSPQLMNSNNDRKIGGPVSESMRSSHDPRLTGSARQNRTRGGSKWDDKPADHDFKESSQFLGDNSGTGFSGLESKDHPKLVEVANKPSAGPNGEQYPHFINNEGSAPTSQNSVSQSLTEINLLSQEKNQEVLGQQLLASAANMQRTIPEGAPVQQTSSHPIGDAASLPYKNSNVVTGILKPPSKISVSADALPVPAMVSFHGLSFNSHAHNDVPPSLSSFIMNAPRGPGFDLNEKVDQISQPYSCPRDQNSLPGQTLKMKDMIDLKNSEVDSRALMTQNVVTSEQVAQITNLSASLAQIFGKGPELPQLYATLNSIPSGLMPSHPNSAGSVVPSVASFPQSNQVVVPSKEYDPIGDSIEVSKSDANVQPSQLVFDSIEQSKIADQEAPTLLKSTGPSSITGEMNGGDSSNSGSMEATLNNQSQEIKQVEPVVKERADEPIDKGQGTAQLDDMDADGQNDEEGRKKKDAKGMRLFKFSLVETVKEILKPKWKEGQMSKEAHKTIVKKVVDKVTSTFQGAHVPQTQEKIDHYLSSSRPKLTKLVHAYVEKYLKT